jgi:6-phosphogluconolactonase (cycloisomerase 2 family)
MHAFKRLGMATASAAAVLAIASGSASAFGGGPFGHNQPGHGQPGSSQPNGGQPGNDQPGNNQPGNNQPGNGQPNGGHPGNGQPGGGNPRPSRNRAVFVQTDNLSGNQIIAYDQAWNGALTQAGAYATGGVGGALEGSVVDHLASQGSLTYDQQSNLLYAVNAGSNTISVFAVLGDHLALRQVLSSGGSFPVSIAAENGLVYVLNAEEGGVVQGFRVLFDHLVPVPGSARPLGLNPTATPQFVNTPGQVAFSADGSRLIVTTKANGSDIDVFRISPFGRLSSAPVVTSLPGAVPFSLVADRYGHLVVAEAGTDALASFQLNWNDTLTQLSSGLTGEQATCWVVGVDGRFYASNAGSASLSGFQPGPGGALSLFSTTPTDAGTVDASATADGRFLYVQAGGAGNVDEYAIEADGTLSEIGSVAVPGAAGGEGIVAQ